MEITNSNKNSALFLKYIAEEGKFNPNNYERILELGQSASGSISQFITQYNQYLLSKKVLYDELERFEIEGAYGYLESDGVFVPKSLKNDDYFILDIPKVPYTRHGYNYPSIDEFDSIVCEGISADLFNVCWQDMDIYLGYCVNLSNEKKLGFNRNFFKHVLHGIGCVVGREYEMMNDIDSKKGKEYCLIKRKR